MSQEGSVIETDQATGTSQATGASQITGTSQATGAGEANGDSGWRGARRELAVAVALVTALAAASYPLAGPAAAGLVVLVSAAVSLVVLRLLVGQEDEPREDAEPYPASPVQSFTGFWRARADLTDGTKSLNAWDRGPRRRLQNLLAAKLAERHGISLATDPETARRLLLGTGSGGRDLWYWIDPQRLTPPDADTSPGIPSAVLTALIDRLEQL